MFSENGFCIGEDRDPEKRKVSYFCLQEDSGAVCWDDISLPEPWWIGLEAIANGIVFLHGYSSPDLPGHQKIYAVDLTTGALLWESSDLQFLSIADGTLIASRDTYEDRLLYQLEMRSGKIIRQLDTESMNRMRDNVQNEILSSVEFPMPIAPDDEVYQSYLEIISRTRSKGRTIEGLELLEKEDVQVLSFYTSGKLGEGKDVFDQDILVYNKRRQRIIYEERIASGLKGIVPDSFYVRNGLLFFIKERKSLIAVPLS